MEKVITIVVVVVVLLIILLPLQLIKEEHECSTDSCVGCVDDCLKSE